MKTRYIILALTAATAAFSACNHLLDIPQHGVQNYETYYQTDEEAEAAIISCYIQVKNNEMNYVLGKNMLTDDFWAGGGGRNDNADLEGLNEFTFGTDQGYLEGMFTSYYGIIYKANVVLGHVPDETEIQKRARAEAKVFRAWSYFELISMWGNPPLVDHELEPSEYQKPNGTTEELWALVEQDLEEAINSGLLTEKKNADDKTWRVTKQFAQALLGKAYLWQGKNGDAADIFDEIIESDLYRLYDNYENVIAFTAKQNCESIFESIKISDPNNVWNNFTMLHLMIHYRTDCLVDNCCTNAGLAGLGWGFLNPQQNLYDDFVTVEGENGYRLNATMKTFDQMKAMGVQIKEGKTLINEGYFMWKWRVTTEQVPAAGSNFVDDSNRQWMRFAEVLLLAAEAHAENGNGTKAAEYMNMIRTRAQAPTKSSYTIDEIRREKRIELCGEGTRFQDLLRWGIAEERMKNQGSYCPILNHNGQIEKKVYNNDPSRYGFKSKHNLLPYPGTEIRLNPNIKQNPGW